MDRIRRFLMSKFFLVPVGTLLLYTLAGFVLIPVGVRWYVPKYAQDQLRCRAILEEIRINPFLMSFEAVGFSLTGPNNEPIARFRRLFIDFETTGLFRWTTVFREVRLEEPALDLSIQPDGSLSLVALAPKSSEEKPEESESRSMGLVFQSLTVAGGKVTLTDKRQIEPTVLILQDLDLDLRTLSTVREQSGSYALAAKTQNGETIQWQGDIGLAPFRSSGQIAFSGIQAATLWGFARNIVDLASPQGTLDLSFDYHLDASGAPMQLSLENLRASLCEVSAKLSNAEDLFVELKKVELNSARFDLASRRIQTDSLLVDGGRLQILIDERGHSNLQQVIRKTPEQGAPNAAPVASVAAAPSSQGEEPWAVDVENIEIKDFAVGLDDMSRQVPFGARASSISIKSSAKIETGLKPKLSLQNLAADLKEIQWGPRDATRRIFEVKSLSLEGGDFDLGAQTLKLAGVRLGDGRLELARDRDGRIDLEHLLAPKPRAGVPARDGTDVIPARHETGSAPPAPEALPWQVDVQELEIKDLGLGFEDRMPEVPVAAGIGSIVIHSKVKVETGRKTQATVTEVSVGLKDAWIANKETRQPIFETRQVSLEGGDLDLAARTVMVSRIALNEGRIDIGREADGKMNFERFLAPRAESVDATTSTQEDAWKFLLKAFELTNFRTAISDGTAVADKALYSLQNINARLTEVDGKSPMGFELGFGLEQGSKVALHGKMDPVARSVEASLSIADLPLAPLQPYIEPFTTLTLKSAAVSTEGLLRYGMPGAGSKISYEGSLSLDKLSLNQPGSEEAYLGWDAMRIPRMKVTVEPNRVQIGEIKLSKPVGQLIILEDKTINLAKVIKERQVQPVQPAKTPPKSGAKKASAPPETARKQREGSFPYNIGKIVIQDGNMVFADLSLRPKFMTRIHALKGTVGNLSSEKKTATEIRLEGRVDRYGMARIGGSLDPADFKRFTDITMVFRNVEMTSVTPYSGKFAGRKIKSGKLSMDLKYRIENTKLVGENQIIVDHLVLGERVDSPDAVNLPLDLAVALLSDSNGRIDIGLPVTGDLNDPQFSIGPLIWKGIINLITKAVTAPFRALGGLFGGGDEKFDVVEFEAGKTELLPPEKEKLKKVTDALQKRPQLKITVHGRYSPSADGLQFKQVAVVHAVAAATGLKPGGDGDPEPLDLGDAKTRRALEKLFVAKFGSPALDEIDRAVKRGEIKPEDEPADKKKAKKRSGIAGLLQSVKFYKLVPGAKSPEQSELLAKELFMRLVESEPVSENALQELAGKRAQVILAELRDAHGIPAERLSAGDSKPVAEGEEPSAELSLDALAGSH